ncbi:AdhP Zn-dependent alcohol dehydrogenases [Candidatus Pelagibacterales bacterium]
MFKVKAFGATSATSPLAPLEIERRDLLKNDVQIEILYCGVCHTDIHISRNEWKGTLYPSVPGHEIIGKVTAIGQKVKRFKVGEVVGVGCFVDSCGQCGSCKEDEEQYCEKGWVGTYNGPAFGGENTYGGYSKSIVVKDHFVLKINHKEKNFAKIAPLLCAGITMYSPLKKWKVKKGMNVGIVGLGGLGQMGVKIAKALGAKVILFTTSENKVKDGLKFGASDVCISSKEEQMAKYMGQLDLIVNTVAASHKLDVYLNLLKKDGTMTLVGAPDQPHPFVEVFNLIFKRRRIAGSLVGGLKETQEMLNFCAKHKIVSDIEVIKMDYINEAYARMLKSDVKYRFVIDMKSL